MAVSKIKKNSKVKIISGDEKGKEGIVVLVDKKRSLVKIEGVNLVTRHYKAKQANEKSGIKVFENFIHISNVALIAAA
jgi:large subunit ribosomal protein L24